MQAELKLLNISNVGIHNLSPGMVTTELLMAGAAHALLALAAKAERWLKVPHNTDEAFIRLLILMPLGRTVTSCLCCLLSISAELRCRPLPFQAYCRCLACSEPLVILYAWRTGCEEGIAPCLAAAQQRCRGR